MTVTRAGRLLAIAILLAIAAPARAGKPFAEIDRILARHPNARIAVAQGSYDWVHDGHLELFGAAKKAFDYVVVVPTREYDKKPFLRASFDRRVRLLEDAIAARPDLRGRVLVSRATQTLPNRPHQIVAALTQRYPGRRFAYVLGSDSFEESPSWPGFDTALANRNIDFVAVTRQGHPVLHPERAALVLRGGASTITSTEIRRALDAGDVSALRGRVPRTTYLALEVEAARRQRERKSFAEVRAEIPAGVTDLLEGIDETRLPDDVRVRLLTVQDGLNAARRAYDSRTLHVSARGIDPIKGYSEKLVVLGRAGGRIRGQYAFKSLSDVDAKKVESLAMLANVLGVSTPPAIPTKLRAGRVAQSGVVTPWIPGMVQAEKYAFGRASGRVLESLVLSRWFSEVVGNQDVWWGQFLRPGSGPGATDELLLLDHKGAWVKRDPRVVQRVLRDHWKIERPLGDTSWTDRTYRFEDPIAWDPAHYDSKFSMYGELWREYVLGRVDVDVDAVKARLQLVKQIPPRVLSRTLAPYLQAADLAHWGQVPVQAAERFMPTGDFEDALLARIYRSVDEYGRFLDAMRAARADAKSEIHRFYAAQGERGF